MNIKNSSTKKDIIILKYLMRNFDQILDQLPRMRPIKGISGKHANNVIKKKKVLLWYSSIDSKSYDDLYVEIESKELYELSGFSFLNKSLANMFNEVCLHFLNNKIKLEKNLGRTEPSELYKDRDEFIDWFNKRNINPRDIDKLIKKLNETGAKGKLKQKTGEKARGISKADSETLLEKLKNPKFHPTEEDMRTLKDNNFKHWRSEEIKQYWEYYSDILDSLIIKPQAFMELKEFEEMVQSPSPRYTIFISQSFKDWCHKKQKDKIRDLRVEITKSKIILRSSFKKMKKSDEIKKYGKETMSPL